MSKLGNIYLSYGKEFKISIANTYSNIVLSGSNLPVNSIIISSNVDDNFEDTGSYSLIATDNLLLEKSNGISSIILYISTICPSSCFNPLAITASSMLFFRPV